MSRSANPADARPRIPRGAVHAGMYSAVMNYLKAVEATGSLDPDQYGAPRELTVIPPKAARELAGSLSP